MKRLIDYHLLHWKDNPHRKPLMLRGARQVGKTFAVRQLGGTFSSFIDINFIRTCSYDECLMINAETESREDAEKIERTITTY